MESQDIFFLISLLISMVHETLEVCTKIGPSGSTLLYYPGERGVGLHSYVSEEADLIRRVDFNTLNNPNNPNGSLRRVCQ
jgi:hypothetical protein